MVNQLVVIPRSEIWSHAITSSINASASTSKEMGKLFRINIGKKCLLIVWPYDADLFSYVLV